MIKFTEIIAEKDHTYICDHCRKYTKNSLIKIKSDYDGSIIHICLDCSDEFILNLIETFKMLKYRDIK